MRSREPRGPPTRAPPPRDGPVRRGPPARKRGADLTARRSSLTGRDPRAARRAPEGRRARDLATPAPTKPDRPDRQRVAAAFRALIESLGADGAPELERTPDRAAVLWIDHLLAGEGVRLADTLGELMPSRSTAPVSLFDVGVHLVCPHHLTVAFGQAHVAYVPGGRIVGFGALARLVGAAAARLSLQEDVTNAIADTLATTLGARAAVAVIEAVHPCHNVLYPRSHRARAVTWAVRGREGKQLERQLRRALAAAARG